jgi:hypothetical protein
LTYSFQNLQDFVLNLLNDPTAQAAYAADPAGALSDAGLGDLTPQDVQEVIPLVTDALPSETPVGDLAVDVTGVMDGTDSLGGSLGVANGLGELGAWGVQTDDGGAAVWGGSATDLLGRLAGGVAVDGNGLAAAATTPLGYADLDTSGNFNVIPADPTDVVDNLGNTGDSVAGTVTNMANTSAQTLAGTVDTGGDTLEGLLSGTPAAGAAQGVESATDMVSEDIQDTAGIVSEQASNLPSATDSLPVADLPAVPDLPEVPGLVDQLPVDLGSLPSTLPADLGSLPSTLPAELPVDSLPLDSLPVDNLPVDVPANLPDTSAVTNVLQHNPVTEAVNSSPVGNLTGAVEGATNDLPLVGDATDDLNLGL